MNVIIFSFDDIFRNSRTRTGTRTKDPASNFFGWCENIVVRPNAIMDESMARRQLYATCGISMVTILTLLDNGTALENLS